MISCLIWLAVLMCLPPSALRWSIGPLPQIEAGAHLGVIASAVVPAASDLELVAEGCERIALEVVDLPCTLQRAVPLQFPKLDLIELGRALQTAAVEGGVVGDERVELLQILTGNLLPHVGEGGRRGGILGAYAVYLDIPIGIGIVLGLYEPRARLDDLAITDDADTHLADGAALLRSRLEVNGDEVELAHSVG